MQSYQLIKVENNKVVLNLSSLDESQQPSFDCLILLNNGCAQWIYDLLIPKARKIIASDGGANFLYSSPFRDINSLAAVIGDLDSLQPTVRGYYNQRNIPILEDSDQDTNDFQKAILYAKNQNFVSLVTLGALGGRIDQELCNLSVIQKYSKLHRQRFIAIGNASLMFLIKQEQEALIFPSKLCVLNQAGLFCFGRSKVSTKGFKWQLSREGGQLEWGQLVSSSNVILSSQLQINTQKQIFFTISLSQENKHH